MKKYLIIAIAAYVYNYTYQSQRLDHYDYKITEIENPENIDNPDLIVWYEDNNITVYGDCNLSENEVVAEIYDCFDIHYKTIKKIVRECVGG